MTMWEKFVEWADQYGHLVIIAGNIVLLVVCIICLCMCVYLLRHDGEQVEETNDEEVEEIDE